MKDPVTIKVDRTTRQALRSLGSKGDSYDDVIFDLVNRLVAKLGDFTPQDLRVVHMMMVEVRKGSMGVPE